MDLHELIDSHAEQPTPLRIEDHLTAGRRAVRRRRAPVALGIASLATAAVLLGAATPWASNGVATDDTPGVATSPGVVPSAQEPPAEDLGEDSPAPAHYAFDGTLVVDPGWEVTDRVERPFTAPVQVNGDVHAVPDASVALEVTNGRRTYWVLAWVSYLEGGHTDTLWEPAEPDSSSLGAWTRIRVALATSGATADVVSVGPDVTMRGRNGVEVLEQRATPELDAPGRRTAVADVTFPGDPRSDGWVLLVRSGDEVTTYPIHDYPVPGDPDRDGPDTIDGFVDWVAPQLQDGRLP